MTAKYNEKKKKRVAAPGRSLLQGQLESGALDRLLYTMLDSIGSGILCNVG